MPKMHTRMKRKLNLTSSKHYNKSGVSTATKKKGSRTFSTEDAASSYAKEHKLTGKIISAKKCKRWKISAEQ